MFYRPDQKVPPKEKCLSVRHITFLSGYICSDTLRMFWHVVTSLTSTMFWHVVTSLKSTTLIVARRRARRCSWCTYWYFLALKYGIYHRICRVFRSFTYLIKNTSLTFTNPSHSQNTTVWIFSYHWHWFLYEVNCFMRECSMRWKLIQPISLFATSVIPSQLELGDLVV